jgi:hypothetical protein
MPSSPPAASRSRTDSSANRSKLDFSPSRDGAQCLGEAIHDRARDFYHLAGTRGRGKSLVLPQLAPDQGQGIGEGRPVLAVPGGLADEAARSWQLAVDQQRDKGEQPEPDRGRATDRRRRPLAPRLPPEVAAGCRTGDRPCQRGRNQARIWAGATAVSVPSSAWVAKFPWGSRLSPPRRDTGGSPL